MGRYDDITDERLRAELTRFARLILRMDEEEVLLARTHSVLRLLGELRQMVFAHEVRNTRRDAPPRPHPLTRMERLEQGGDVEAGAEPVEPGPEDSLRIVREALEREREFLDRLTQPDDGPDDGDNPS
jgi:hypothetical protein